MIKKGEFMRKVVVAINPSKDKDESILKYVVEKLKKTFFDIEIIIVNSYNVLGNDAVKEAELLVVLGGDGTILGVARQINGNLDVPIFGINIGNLGFISSVEITDLDKALSKIKSGCFNIQERIMLGCSIDNGENEKLKALNDIVVTKGSISRMLELEVYVDGKLYCDFKGDGLIISTPTGSTAYSFSAGGPFISPDIDVLILTPICPQGRRMNTIVIKSNSNIKIVAKNNKGRGYVSFDGQKSIKLDEISVINITRSQDNTKILLLDDYDYFKLLRNKIL